MAKFYLSSTSDDLKECREEVAAALWQMGHQVINMEHYTADTRPPLKVCLDDVSRCDAYIGIFAWRYGSIPEKDNPEKKAFTELEYREALRLKKDTLIFILDIKAAWPGDRYAEDEELKRIKALRDELCRDKTVRFFRNHNDLATQVSVTVAKRFPVIEPDTDPPPPGPSPTPQPPQPSSQPWWRKQYALAALALIVFVSFAYIISKYWMSGKSTTQELEEYPTKRDYDFYLWEKDRLSERWDFPPGQWSLEKGEGENEDDAALLVKGNQMGIPKDLGNKVFRNYRAEFKVLFKEGDKVAWVLRAQSDKQSGYLFELRREYGKLFIKGWILKNNQLAGDLPGDKPLEYSVKCCKPTDGLRVVVNVLGTDFDYEITFERGDEEDTEEGGTSAKAVFVDSSATFKAGSFGLLVTDGITPWATSPATVMKVEYVSLTPLPSGQSAAGASPERSSP